MTKSKVDKASEHATTLNDETQALLHSVRSKNNKALKWFIVCWTILFLLAVGGIWKQNQIANQSKNHLDCIVKLFTTPIPKDQRSRTISNPNTTCNIQFQQ